MPCLWDFRALLVTTVNLRLNPSTDCANFMCFREKCKKFCCDHLIIGLSLKKERDFWVIPVRTFCVAILKTKHLKTIQTIIGGSLETIFFCSVFLLMMHWIFKISAPLWRIKADSNYSVTGGKERLYFWKKKTKTQHKCCEIQKCWKPMTAYETCPIKICRNNCSCQKLVCDKYPSATSIGDIFWWVSLRSP